MNLVKALTDYITKHNVRYDSFIVAVSGGKDSMSLLHACKKIGLNITAAHCNFKLRGDESDGDEDFVTEYCHNNNIHLEKTAFDTKTEAKKRKLSTQETARVLRYKWFEEVRTKNKAGYILTAHHGNDVVETFIINLLRGSGIKGLTGIPHKNDFILRPLLACLSTDIDTYIADYNIPYRKDSSNESDAYTRNNIRHHVIPLLQTINTNAVKHILTASSLLHESYKMQEDFLAEFTKHYTNLNNDTFCINFDALQPLPYKRTLLFHWLNKFGFNSAVIEEIMLPHESGKYWQSQSHTIYYERGKLYVTTTDSYSIADLLFKHTLPSALQFGSDKYQIKFLSKKPSVFKPNAIYADADMLHFPVKMRQWKTGDFFNPLGMNNNKKVSDFFIDSKLTSLQKQQAMIIETTDEIFAVAPYRVSDRFKVTDKTTRILSIEKTM